MTRPSLRRSRSGGPPGWTDGRAPAPTAAQLLAGPDRELLAAAEARAVEHAQVKGVRVLAEVPATRGALAGRLWVIVAVMDAELQLYSRHQAPGQDRPGGLRLNELSADINSLLAGARERYGRAVPALTELTRERIAELAAGP